ncbi:hypothetical protein C5S32_02940 [ANME-1 cluster archaeon GoMg1]|nr:hypothetical protein [ANME-1 cluster archaeon GoMg1]
MQYVLELTINTVLYFLRAKYITLYLCGIVLDIHGRADAAGIERG